MARALVLGLGNRLSGADAFGPAVLDQLGRAGVPVGIDAIEAGTDLLRHIDRFADYDAVVLIDAVVGGEDRRIEIIPERTFETWDARLRSAHELSAVGCVTLFRALQPRTGDTAKPVITLVALMTPEEDFGCRPTPAEVDEAAAAVYLACFASV